MSSTDKSTLSMYVQSLPIIVSTHLSDAHSTQNATMSSNSGPSFSTR